MASKELSWARLEAEDTEHTLSFRNFSTLNNIQGPTLHIPRNPSSEEFFRFELQSPLPDRLTYTNPDTNFYNQEDDEEHLNEYQKRDYLTVVRSNSFSRQSPTHEAKSMTVSKDDLGSIRYSYSPKQSPASYPVQKVNITSLTSMSAKSRRRMFMFGPVKFEPEMELNAIKERQARRRVPATIFPATDGVMPQVAGGRTAKSGGNSSRSKIMRSIRGTVHVAAVLARSVACIPLSIAAITHKH